MDFCEYLQEEWKPALGCTEPASIAYAAASAAGQAEGAIRSVELECDPRIYKNCYAVGIPHSGHKTGDIVGGGDWFFFARSGGETGMFPADYANDFGRGKWSNRSTKRSRQRAGREGSIVYRLPGDPGTWSGTGRD